MNHIQMQQSTLLKKPVTIRMSQYFSMLSKDFTKYKYLYIMAVPVIAYYLIFHYLPLYGLVIAFKNFSPSKGILGSQWIGFRHFYDFFSGPYFMRVLMNTVKISFYDILFGFPAPIILALLLNEVRSRHFKSLVQTVTYMPHFISIMVICGMLVDFTAKDGLINNIIAFFGGTRVSMLTCPEMFRSIYIGSNVWQSVGWGAIIYISALSGISEEQYEAATIDGAGRWKQLLHVTLPGLAPTIIIMLILRIGQMMNIGYEKIILLYNPLTYETADVISSFVYRRGIIESNYSFSAAVGLFNSVINFVLLLFANKLSKKITDTSLF